MNFINSLRQLQRNPRAILALFLIALSFLAAIVITLSVGKKTTFWVASTDIAPGTAITMKSVHSISLVQENVPLNYVTSSSSLVGKFSTRIIHKNELLSEMDVSKNSLHSSITSLPIRVLKNNFPATLQIGDFVDVYALASNSSQLSSTLAKPGLALSHARVININNANSSYGNEVGITVESKSKNNINALSLLNGANVVVVKDGE